MHQEPYSSSAIYGCDTQIQVEPVLAVHPVETIERKLPGSAPEGPTVQFTGTLMALPCVLLRMRRPKYSSLHTTECFRWKADTSIEGKRVGFV